MGTSHRAVQIAFTALASTILFILNYFYPLQIQQFADMLFQSYIPTSQFRLYVLDGIVIGVFFLMAVFSIHGIANSAKNELKG